MPRHGRSGVAADRGEVPGARLRGEETSLAGGFSFEDKERGN